MGRTARLNPTDLLTAFVAIPDPHGNYHIEELPSVQTQDRGFSAAGINAGGVVIGNFQGGAKAGFWTRNPNGKWTGIYLDSIANGGPCSFTQVGAINDTGQITGTAECNDGERIFRLTPD